MDVHWGPASTRANCDAGTTSITVPAYVADAEIYISAGGYESARIRAAADVIPIPTLVIAWDGAYVRAHWAFQDAQGAPARCDVTSSPLSRVELAVDDMPLWQDTPNCESLEALAGPIEPGIHSLRADGLGEVMGTYTAITMSAPVDITVEAGSLVDSPTMTIIFPQ